MTRYAMTLAAIGDTIVDEASPPSRLRQALDDYALLCSDISGILPNPSFDGWAEDSLLTRDIIDNPQAPYTKELIAAVPVPHLGVLTSENAARDSFHKR